MNRNTTQHATATPCFSRLALAVLLAVSAVQTAVAQSTGTLATEGMEEIIVTGQGALNMAGVTAQDAAKSRVTVTGEMLKNYASGQTFLDSLNQVPGLNFTNNDPYGSSGGNLRLRGFDGSRVSLTFDGIPLNDTGNYAIYTNQQIDPEIIQSVDVNLGTTDVDSPTASAIGGTINSRTRLPAEEMGGLVSAAAGQDNFQRYFGMLDSGAFGPWNTRAFIAGSYSGNDKFKGPGDMFKRQLNARIHQELDNGNFISVSAHYNRNRNNFYRNATEAQWALFGRDYDNTASCVRDSATGGVRDDDNATLIAGTTALPATDNVANPSACTNYYNLRINPSNTGNIRLSSLWNLTDNVRLTVDPSWQYVLANGGGTTMMNETPGATTVVDRRVTGNTALTGWDLNGDGDILDSVRFYSPNTTNTRRFGLNASLIWDLSETQLLRFAYAYDYGKHRQTGEFGLVDAGGNPEDVFGGRNSTKIFTADGSYLRGRDRFSIAELNQYSVEYRSKLMEEKLTVTLGLRAPFFERELNQFCYSVNASGNVLCTTQQTTSTLANGNVRFGTATTEYIAPYSAKVKFDQVLPNIGVSYALSDTQSVYASYAGGLSSPRTDNLYSVRRQADGSVGRANPEPEETDSYDIGWRLQGDGVLASAAYWQSMYKNRIASSFDPDLGFSVDRNVGDVDLRGIDTQVGFSATDWMTMSVMVSWNDSELQDNLAISATTTLPTAGKKFVETPEWTYGMRFELEPMERLTIGFEGKWVDERYTTDLNDAKADAYVLFHLNAAYEMAVNNGDSMLRAQMNVYNLFDEEFFGNISSTTGAVARPGFTPSSPFLSIGAPRSVSASLQLLF
jgi:iron complex outermembrane receptor protein